MNTTFRVFDRQGIAQIVTSSRKQHALPDEMPRRRSGKPGGEGPEWTQGLRHLYNSVVEEPLPDNFKDLLAQLDKGA